MSALEAQPSQPATPDAPPAPLVLAEAPTWHRVHARACPDTVPALLHAVSGNGPSPAGDEAGNMLAGALATCLLSNLERSARLLGLRYELAEVEVTALRQPRPPRFVEMEYRLHITTDEPAGLVHLVHRNLRWHGSVFNTVAAVCHVHGTVGVVRP